MKGLLQPHTNENTLQSGIDFLHNEITGWLSELAFCKTELTFLNKVLDKAFLRVSNEQKINELLTLSKKVRTTGIRSLGKIQSRIFNHEHHLSLLDEDLFSQNEQLTREEHEKIGVEVKLFMAAIKELKKEIFTVVEKQLKLIKNISIDFEEGSLAL